MFTSALRIIGQTPEYFLAANACDTCNNRIAYFKLHTTQDGIEMVKLVDLSTNEYTLICVICDQCNQLVPTRKIKKQT